MWGGCVAPKAVEVQVLRPERRVIFLDTDAAEAEECQLGDALSNAAEAAYLRQIVKAFTACCVPLSDVGLVSPYRSQARRPPRVSSQGRQKTKSLGWAMLRA